MSLEDQVSEKAKEIHTDGYPMSIGEVISMYRDSDIDIHPEFQRIFRWNIEQKSRLIESILLKIPIPPIFVSQRKDGVWDVIDGVQRLSTILEFVGIYRDEERRLRPPSVLEATEYLPDLEGYTWEVGDRVFSDVMQRDFKRAKIEFRIIAKQSDANAKYDMFQRLNSGTQLSLQEARNCLLVMLNVSMFNELVRLAETPNFIATVPLSEAKESQSYRQELALRFFLHASYHGRREQLDKEYGDYLTDWMRAASKTYGTDSSEIDSQKFEETFSLLDRALGEDAFRRFDGHRHLGAFSISSFEFVTAGVVANLADWIDDPDGLRDRIRSSWSAPEFRDNSGTGVSPRRRVPRLITDARVYFSRSR
ncbi:Protein of unknown function DUF262 [Amycolatopsis tolypomycina]|uniref:GmrSD restriction endonucleases N-terminal domain-containing protein n=2 Tax=Amycolatopsis tolypomycina TaxID=208445 RepID=A0A1H5BM13_9PSEU|nr:Protein of unknown function DUF262 [Amycolatopsis tolypomycina]